MIPEKKKQLQTLGLLAVLLAGAGGYAYWSISTPSTGVATSSPAEKVAKIASLPSAGNARIRLDLITDDQGNGVVGRKNVFQYYVAPPPAKMQTVVLPPKPPAPVVVGPTGPPPPPPPPPTLLTTFKYDGVVIVPVPGKLMASISNGSTDRYNVTEGEYILGRYKINRVTATNVEIEDTDQNRRQTYTRIVTP